MTTITAISPIARTPELVSVRVAGRVVARVRATDVETLGLRVGLAWTEQLDARVRDADARLRARRDALRLLGRRARSRGELSERLGGRHEPPVVEGVLDELAKTGLIDDLAYGRAYAAELLARAPAGRGLVVERLVRRHLDPALAERIADEALDAAGGDDGVAWARRRMATMGGVRPEVAARRLASGLARRGVDEDRIRSTLADLDLPWEDEAT